MPDPERDLEKGVDSSTQLVLHDDNTFDHRQHSNNSSHTTLRNSNTGGSTSELNVEAKFEPALHHELDLRKDLQAIEASPLSDELPSLKLFSWSRYAVLNVYRRLFSIVFFGNIAAFIWFMLQSRSPLGTVNAAAANLLALGLARQPLVVNLLFLIFGNVPRRAPLRLRRVCAKVYCYGGIHSGCGIASLLWYLGFIGLLTKQYVDDKNSHSPQSIASPAVMSISYIILVLLLAIIIAAYPKIRFHLHDYFELTHRFCGWAIVILFWPLLILASIAGAESSNQTLGQYLLHFPTFWMLIIVVLAIVHPWILLRKVPISAEPISPHAIRLHFHHTTINFGQGIQLSKHPLRDWHSFASFPDVPSLPGTNGSCTNEAGFSALISKAGDWTSDTIARPPTHLWKRGIPISGFGYAMRLFTRLLLVTTGSGIGPCLSFLGDPDRPAMRVVWQTKSPLKTYGKPIVDLVRRLDEDVEILDTGVTGRQDMLPLVLRLAREWDAEAVCVISNPMVTRRLVFECEARGVPAFGPIFDS